MNNIVKLYEERIKEDQLPYFEVEEYINIILHYYEKNRLQLAFEAIDRALILFPENPMIVDLSANIFLVTGEDEEALEVLERIQSEELPHQLTSISVYLRHQMIQKADALMRPLIFSKKVPIEALWKVIIDYYNEGFGAKAIDYYEVLFENKDKLTTLMIHYFVEYCRTEHQLKRAINQLNKLLDEDPYRTEVWIELGNALLQDKAKKEALDAFETALAINPELIIAHNMVASIYEDLDNADKAIEHYIRSVEIDFKDGQASMSLAQLYLYNCDYTNALIYFTKVCDFYHKKSLNKKDKNIAHMLTECYLNISICYEQQELYLEALQAVEKALKYVALTSSEGMANLLLVKKATYRYASGNSAINNETLETIIELAQDENLQDLSVEYSICTFFALTQQYEMLDFFLEKCIEKNKDKDPTYEPIFMMLVGEKLGLSRETIISHLQIMKTFDARDWLFRLIIPSVRKELENIINKYQSL